MTRKRPFRVRRRLRNHPERGRRRRVIHRGPRQKEKAKLPKRLRARNNLRKLVLVFIALTIMNLARMAFGLVSGGLMKNQTIEALGGEKILAELEDAEIERPYYAPITNAVDATSPWHKHLIRGTFARLRLVGCFVILHTTCQWHLGVAGTLHFTIALWYEVLVLAVCAYLYWRWWMIANGKPLRKKPQANLKEETKRQNENATKAEKARLSDPDRMTPTEMAEQLKAMSNRQRVQQWGDNPLQGRKKNRK